MTITITHWGILWWWLLPRNLRLGLLFLKEVPESFHSDGHFSLLKKEAGTPAAAGGEVWLIFSVQFANSLGNADATGEDHVGDASLLSLLNLHRNIHQKVSECSRRLVAFLSKVRRNGGVGRSGTTDFLAPQLCRKKWQQLKLVGSTLGLNAFGNVWIPKLFYPSGTQTRKQHTYTNLVNGHCQ